MEYAARTPTGLNAVTFDFLWYGGMQYTVIPPSALCSIFTILLEINGPVPVACETQGRVYLRNSLESAVGSAEVEIRSPVVTEVHVELATGSKVPGGIAA